jgi:hypothetical protein
MDEKGLKGDDWEQMLDDIQILETAAMETMTGTTNG